MTATPRSDMADLAEAAHALVALCGLANAQTPGGGGLQFWADAGAKIEPLIPQLGRKLLELATKAIEPDTAQPLPAASPPPAVEPPTVEPPPTALVAKPVVRPSSTEERLLAERTETNKAEAVDLLNGDLRTARRWFERQFPGRGSASARGQRKGGQ